MSFVKIKILTIVFLSQIVSIAIGQKASENDVKNIQVILFIAPDCPISQKYITKIKSIYKDHESNIDFNIYFPDQYDISSINEFKKEYSIVFEILKDKDNSIAQQMKTKVTPEVYLLKNGVVEYSGAIDNWFYELGKSRLQVTHNYLTDAITSLVQNKKPEILKTRAIGCFINH